MSSKNTESAKNIDKQVSKKLAVEIKTASEHIKSQVQSFIEMKMNFVVEDLMNMKTYMEDVLDRPELFYSKLREELSDICYSDKDGSFDIIADRDIVLESDVYGKIDYLTGYKLYLPEKYIGVIHQCYSVRKFNVISGIVHPESNSELSIMLQLNGISKLEIKKGDKIAQIFITRIAVAELIPTTSEDMPISLRSDKKGSKRRLYSLVIANAQVKDDLDFIEIKNRVYNINKVLRENNEIIIINVDDEVYKIKVFACKISGGKLIVKAEILDDAIEIYKNVKINVKDKTFVIGLNDEENSDKLLKLIELKKN